MQLWLASYVPSIRRVFHTLLQLETDALLGRARAATERAKELKALADSAAAAADAAKEETRAVQRELAATRADAEGMVKVLAALEKQVADVEEREARARKAEEDAAERVRQAVLERDQAVSREQQSRRELARLLDRRRAEITEASAHEAEAVADVRARLTAQLAAHDAELAAARAEVAAAGAAAERAQRDARSVQLELSKLQEASRAEQGRLQRTIDDLASKLAGVEEERDDAVAQAREAVARAAMQVETATREQQEAQQRAVAAESAAQRLARELADSEMQLRSARQAGEDANAALDAARRQLGEAKARAARDAAEAAAHAEAERHAAEARASKLASQLAAATGRAAELQAAVEGSGMGAAVGWPLAITDGNASFRPGTPVHPTAQLLAYQDENVRLRARVAELSSTLQYLQREFARLSTAAVEQEASTAHIRAAQAAAEATVTELSMQLAAMSAREDDRMRELQESKTECELAKLAAARSAVRADTLQAKLDATQAARAKAEASLAGISSGAGHFSNGSGPLSSFGWQGGGATLRGPGLGALTMRNGLASTAGSGAFPAAAPFAATLRQPLSATFRFNQELLAAQASQATPVSASPPPRFPAHSAGGLDHSAEAEASDTSAVLGASADGAALEARLASLGLLHKSAAMVAASGGNPTARSTDVHVASQPRAAKSVSRRAAAPAAAPAATATAAVARAPVRASAPVPAPAPEVSASAPTSAAAGSTLSAAVASSRTRRPSAASHSLEKTTVATRASQREALPSQQQGRSRLHDPLADMSEPSATAHSSRSGYSAEVDTHTDSPSASARRRRGVAPSDGAFAAAAPKVTAEAPVQLAALPVAPQSALLAPARPATTEAAHRSPTAPQTLVTAAQSPHALHADAALQAEEAAALQRKVERLRAKLSPVSAAAVAGGSAAPTEIVAPSFPTPVAAQPVHTSDAASMGTQPAAAASTSDRRDASPGPTATTDNVSRSASQTTGVGSPVAAQQPTATAVEAGREQPASASAPVGWARRAWDAAATGGYSDTASDRATAARSSPREDAPAPASFDASLGGDVIEEDIDAGIEFRATVAPSTPGDAQTADELALPGSPRSDRAAPLDAMRVGNEAPPASPESARRSVATPVSPPTAADFSIEDDDAGVDFVGAPAAAVLLTRDGNTAAKGTTPVEALESSAERSHGGGRAHESGPGVDAGNEDDDDATENSLERDFGAVEDAAALEESSQQLSGQDPDWF